MCIKFYKKNEGGVYAVHYKSESHLSVIFQCAGSVWRKVLPLCLFNGFIALVIQRLRDKHGIDLGISDKGHSLTTLFVSFLIVSRVTMSLARYNQTRADLGNMYRDTRKLVQNIVVFTKADQSDRAKQYRNDLAYTISIMLRLAMAVIDYPDTNEPCWKLSELNGKPKAYILENVELSDACRHNPEPGKVSQREQNMRVPIQMSYLLREQVYAVNKHVDKQFAPIGPWEFKELFGSIDSFMGAYYGMRKFMTTPFPFPLVQMARTFMFIYLETLPFALLDTIGDNQWVHAVICFLVTYGFVGLETVSIELDNPFGDDENDFDNLAMAYTALEDTYITIYKADGEEWMRKLKNRLIPKEWNQTNGEEYAWETSPLTSKVYTV